jgi:hypothetical protein
VIDLVDDSVKAEPERDEDPEDDDDSESFAALSRGIGS